MPHPRSTSASPSTGASPPRRHRGLLAVPLAAALAVAAPAAASSAATHTRSPQLTGLVTVVGAPGLPAGAHAAGAVASTNLVRAAVALRLPDQAAVTNFIDSTSNPGSANYHHYLGKGQFAKRFGPHASAISAVESQLRSDGLRVTGLSANHLLLSFSGTASKVESAFHTGLEQVRLASGQMGRATSSAARLPASISHYVQSVVGLDQLVHESNGLEHANAAHEKRTPSAKVTTTSNGGPVACADATAQQQTGALTDQQVANSYGLEPLYGADDLGAGQTIDIYELEPFSTSDISIFDKCYFGGTSHTSQITVTPVDGGPGTGYGSGEAALDVEDVSAIAPDADIHVFSGPNMDDPWGPLDTWNQIAIADDARQVSSSWGLCETEEQVGAPGVQEVENEIFEQTAAQGQTIFSSAGDDGSDDCAGHNTTPTATDLSLDDPASQPYVTSVGGTTIYDATEPPAETVWNNGNWGGAGGGGISETWAMPPWQSSVAVDQDTANQACSNDPSGTADEYHLAGDPTTLPSGTLCRETPDVSALADPQTGITIVYGGGWSQIGGTSSSTPLWAAMFAEINASSSCSGVTDGIGFADPSLYQVASSSASNYADAFNDVTQGNNDNLAVGDGSNWEAGTGYDLASGLGTPRITDSDGAPGLASQLCTIAAGSGTAAPPVVTSMNQVTGSSSIAGGGTLNITGTGFGSSTGEVYFGTVDAPVVSWSTTAIVVNIPAYAAPPGTPTGAGGRADVTVVTAATPAQSSAPSDASTYDYTADSSGSPIVDYVSPPTGPTAGGNTVDIVGSGFSGATAVDFGDVAAGAGNFTVLNDNEISVTVPASDSNCAVSASQGICAVAVTVTTPSGTSSGPAILPAYQGPIEFEASGAFVAPAGCECEIVQAPEEYDYSAAPTLSSVSPTYASENGTTAEVISGTGFNLLTFEWLNVGPAGQNFSSDYSLDGVTPTQLTVTIPPAEPTVDPTTTPISVQSADQLSNVSSLSYAGTPDVSAISKHLAASQDPGDLTISGRGLQDATSVVFQAQGDLDFLTSVSTTFTAQSKTSLTVQVPQFFIFPTDVLVCSITGCSAPNPKVDSFQLAYAGRPVVTSSSPSSGPASGGTIVFINGALDAEVTAVDFGTTPAVILQQTTDAPSGPILVEAPAGTAGKTVSITISTLGGTLVGKPTSAKKSKATFTYIKSGPTAPQDVTAKAGVKSASLSWKAPADDGGSSITGYDLIAKGDGHRLRKSVSAKTTSYTFTGLAAGDPYTFTVTAVNSVGRGLTAKAGPVTPRS